MVEYVYCVIKGEKYGGSRVIKIYKTEQNAIEFLEAIVKKEEMEIYGWKKIEVSGRPSYESDSEYIHINKRELYD